MFLILFSNLISHENRNDRFFVKTYNNIKRDLPRITIPGVSDNRYHISFNPLYRILIQLTIIHPYTKEQEYIIDCARYMFSKIHPSELGKTEVNTSGWNNRSLTVFDNEFLTQYFKYTPDTFKDSNLFAQYWFLISYRYQNTPKSASNLNLPSLHEYCEAYKLELCTKDELFARIMTSDGIHDLTRKPMESHVKKKSTSLLQKYPFLEEMIAVAKNRILEIELRRGDSSTPVTVLAQSIQSVKGIDYLIQILNGLGKDSMNRGYIYSYGNQEYSKKEVLSVLLKRCHPLNTETQDEFNKAIKSENISEKRLVEVALYAQQWLPFVSNYLEWNGLESAAWWLHAHTNAYHTAETETEVGRYSNITMNSFRDGAVDFDWFQESYKELGKKRWKILYDAAKYITDGAGHNRAKLYADVMTGATKITEVTNKIKDKRNQDFIRVYGLVPLSKTVPKKDLLKRFNYLVQLKKESKQFGAQRQASEALAINLAMENLARTAGYPDPIRLTWAMETEEAKHIIQKSKVLKYDDVSIQLIVDKNGKAKIEASRNGKMLKNIPSKLKKEGEIIELKDFQKRLKEQYTRSRKSLEEAMVRGDIFETEEVKTLSEHPVISPLLSKLVFISEGKLGFYTDGKLIDSTGSEHIPGNSIRIAHCTDFHKHNIWPDLQRYCFENEIIQPFKQIFRELYIPTADELQENSISRRYAGHQVQPKKTLALLKSRAWTVDYDEGLQKVYHKEGLIAKLYAMADWFSPADVESPTLETIEFRDRATHKPVPFKEITPLIFSEVMRDIDLVVSVAHVGGVDPEASLSTVELRASILKETTRLFKLDNVTIKGHHALIKGHFADYSIHLGSAVVHLNPGKFLSILPVHSQHRADCFYPLLMRTPDLQS